MARICVSVVVEAGADAVWGDLSDIASHVEWMADAVAIEFTTMRRHGVGTAFDCLTKVGPIRLTDKMVCTEWVPGEVMGIRHVGLVTGIGRLSLSPHGQTRTLLTWEEILSFPLMLGGPIGAFVGGRLILRRIWAKNLRTFARRF